MTSAFDRVVVLHGAVAPDAPADEQDVLVEVRAVRAALERLGHRVQILALTLDLQAARTQLDARPQRVFNLVESIGGSGRLAHLGPALLEELGLPYTGAPLSGLFLSSNKRLAKRLLGAADIATPALWGENETGKSPLAPLFQRGEGPAPSLFQKGERPGRPVWKKGVERIRDQVGGLWIVKSAWEHASIGLNDDSVIEEKHVDAVIDTRRERYGGEWFAEEYIEGREFNLALLQDGDGPQILPPAEIRFENFPSHKPRIVGYEAKWHTDSFEYRHTTRTFDFPDCDEPLLKEIEKIAQCCWELFDCRGYARVDFRVDKHGVPWVLEVNANPCLSPDAGFAAAAIQAGLDYDAVIARILDAALRSKPISQSHRLPANHGLAPRNRIP